MQVGKHHGSLFTSKSRYVSTFQGSAKHSWYLSSWSSGRCEPARLAQICQRARISIDTYDTLVYLQVLSHPQHPLYIITRLRKSEIAPAIFDWLVTGWASCVWSSSVEVEDSMHVVSYVGCWGWCQEHHCNVQLRVGLHRIGTQSRRRFGFVTTFHWPFRVTLATRELSVVRARDRYRRQNTEE